MQNDLRAPGIFESFNARSLSPVQVAKTFIPPPIHFDDIVKQTHSLVIGPRGSGKTTLLKMLQTPALAAWEHPAAPQYRQRIGFTGVFVPTDIAWSAQLTALGGGKISDQCKVLLGTAAFTLHVLIAFIEAAGDRLERNGGSVAMPVLVSLSRENEAKLVHILADAWYLKPDIDSFLGIRLSLRQRLSQIHEIASRIQNCSADEAWNEIKNIQFLHLHFLTSLVLAVEAFNGITDRSHDRWAILFDELELAPKFIRQQLIISLRSIDQRLLFKLSISPYSEDVGLLESALSAMPGQDYLPIRLWYPRKEDSYTFCEALLESMLKQHGGSPAEPEKVFGKSEFDTEAIEWTVHGTAYHSHARLARRFQALADKDISFGRYLAEHDIDPYRMDALPKEAREAYVRKVASLVVVRLAFRRPDNTPQGSQRRPPRSRSRKSPRLYAGAKGLFALVEGNPRWFIGITTALLPSYIGSGKPISYAQQAREVEKATSRFRALLKTIPCEPVRGSRAPRGLLTILDTIGQYFYKTIVLESFTPEPAGTFTVDTNCERELLDALAKALNAGAIVYIPDEDSEGMLSSIRGKRFRLSYLLAPHYKLPLTVGRPKSLYKILAGADVVIDDLFVLAERSGG